MMIGPWQRFPNTVILEDEVGVAIIAALECSLWDDADEINPTEGPAIFPGRFLTMWCEFNVLVEVGRFVRESPVGDGAAGVDERYLIRGVNPMRHTGILMLCDLERTTRES